MSEKIYIAGTKIRIDHIKPRLRAAALKKIGLVNDSPRGRGKVRGKGGKLLK